VSSFDFNNTTPLEAALEYARQGFGVVPAFSPLMFRPNTFKSRFFNIAYYQTGKAVLRLRFIFWPLRQLKKTRYWFTRYPNANIAVATGSPTGLAVIDVDRYFGGHLHLKSLNLPETRQSLTGDGEHYYFRLPEKNMKLATIKNALAPGITVSAEYCFATLPPSFHGIRKHYQWVNPDTPIAVLPDDIVKKLQSYPPPGIKYIIRTIFFFYLRKKYALYPLIRFLLWAKTFINKTTL
jgi:putative DNA primase/helicase